MQDEIHEFERLKVWELVPRPSNVVLINLKWIFKVKLDEYGGVLKNKAQLVAKGFHWEEEEYVEREGSGGGSENIGEVKVVVWSGIFIKQSKYALEILKKYGLDQCNPVDIPIVERLILDEDPNRTPVDLTCYRGMVGSLMYLTASYPNLMFVVCMCARYQAKPTKKHLTTVKRVFRYLNGTINMGLWYPKDTEFDLMAFVDANHAGFQDSRKSTSGSEQFLGEKLVSWLSKKQKCTIISTTKAEYVFLSGCCAQILWMWSQLTDYGFDYNKIPLYCDSKSAIAFPCNTVQHLRTKHIAVRYHFIKEQVENEIVELYFIKTAYQLADIFTKALARECFKFLVKRLDMQSLTPEELKHLAESDEDEE
ncbi:hypothetical protein Tco_0478265 [Tanacetum coccineum]